MIFTKTFNGRTKSFWVSLTHHPTPHPVHERYKIGRGKNLLRGNVEGNGPQVDALVRIDARDDKEDSGTLLIKAGHTYICTCTYLHILLTYLLTYITNTHLNINDKLIIG